MVERDRATRSHARTKISGNPDICQGEVRRLSSLCRLSSGATAKAPMGIAVRENDSKWRDFINFTLIEMWEDGT